MNICIIGLLSNNLVGIEAAFYFLISHGIISSGLFLLIGSLYTRYHTRNLIYYKGLVLLYPLFSTFFVLFQLGNIAFPLTCGFISEFLIFLSIFSINPGAGFFATLAIILTPLYVLKLLHSMLYGTFSPYLLPSFDLSKREFHTL